MCLPVPMKDATCVICQFWAQQCSGFVQDSSSEGEDEQGGGAKAEGDVDMQVTFDSGLETLGERLASKKGSKAAETLWQQYEKRRRCSQMPLLHPLFSASEGLHFSAFSEQFL